MELIDRPVRHDLSKTRRPELAAYVQWLGAGASANTDAHTNTAAE